jgi:hypothetical protein
VTAGQLREASRGSVQRQAADGQAECGGGANAKGLTAGRVSGLVHGGSVSSSGGVMADRIGAAAS